MGERVFFLIFSFFLLGGWNPHLNGVTNKSNLELASCPNGPDHSLNSEIENICPFPDWIPATSLKQPLITSRKWFGSTKVHFPLDLQDCTTSQATHG